MAGKSSGTSHSTTSSARQGPAPVYVISGADDWLRDEALARVLAGVVDDADDPAACSEFDARSPLAEVLDDLQTLPMLAAHRVVVIRDADPFIKQHREALERYCREPSPTASLVLMCKSLPSNWRLARVVREVGVLERCDPLKGQALVGWIARRAREGHDKTIERPAASRLQRLIGDDLQALNSELLKLATYVGPQPDIRLEDVERLVGLRREERVFGIADALIHGNAARGLALWDQVWTTDRAAPARAIGGLAWALRRYLDAKYQQTDGARLGALARQFWTTEAELNARLCGQSLSAFEDHLGALQAADAGVKVGAHDARSAVEKLIVTRCAEAST